MQCQMTFLSEDGDSLTQAHSLRCNNRSRKCDSSRSCECSNNGGIAIKCSAYINFELVQSSAHSSDTKFLLETSKHFLSVAVLC